jgi:hypothetical protein
MWTVGFDAREEPLRLKEIRRLVMPKGVDEKSSEPPKE